MKNTELKLILFIFLKYHGSFLYLLQCDLAERGLQVLVDNKLAQQCIATTMKANGILGCICRAVSSRDRDLIIQLYPVLVRPHVQHCVKFWFLQFKKDKDRPERVQRRTMKMIKVLENMPHEERLKAFSFFNLEKRRIRGTLSSFPVLKDRLHREWRVSLHKDPHGEDKVLCVQVAPEEVSL